jgi:hypothetical protein
MLQKPSPKHINASINASCNPPMRFKLIIGNMNEISFKNLNPKPLEVYTQLHAGPVTRKVSKLTRPILNSRDHSQEKLHRKPQVKDLFKVMIAKT